MESQSMVVAEKPDSRVATGGCLLGIALGGFFDGILLHQILQWHHLFSAVAPSGTLLDLRFQILADGVFHLLHYVVALAGLAFLWSGRKTLQAAGGRRLAGWALVGFGGWHAFDAVVSHWLLQIHRIRMDVDNPLFWDLAWLFPFGILPLVAGVWLLRSRPGDTSGGAPGGRFTAASLAFAALVAGPVAAVPPAGALDNDMTLAVFRPGASFSDVVAAADAVDGRLVWTDENRGVWLIAPGPGANVSRLYRHGAWLVSRGPVAVGCLSWTGV